MTDELRMYQEEIEPESAQIIQLFLEPKARRPMPEPRASAAELAEYRRIKPLLMEMLREWQLAKGASGCPVLRKITSKD